MNHSEDYLELLEVTIMPEEYCFVYGDDNKNDGKYSVYHGKKKPS